MDFLSFYLLCQIFAKATALSEATCCNPSGTNTTCEVTINGTVCLVCLTPNEDKSARWYRGKVRIFRSNNYVSQDGYGNSYSTECHGEMYSLRVSNIGCLGRDDTFYECKTNNSAYGFTLMPREHPTVTNEDRDDKGDDKSNHDGNAGGIVALYIIVPCLFIASIVTSLLLYYKAKHYRQRKFEARKSSHVLDTATFDEGNHDGTVCVYSDITKEEDEPVTKLAAPSSIITTTLISRLKASGTFEYWSATYVNESSEEQKCFAKTLSSLATMKDATKFQELALKLKALPDNNFIVQILCVSVEEIPYSICYEYMECGSLRDFMLRRYQQARKSRMSLSIGNPEILPANVKSQIEELLTFATMIAEALKFITSQKLCHPSLSLKKVLLSEYCECKLYDIYPTEMAMTRINDLMKKDDPPIAWMAVETIFLQEYQTSSDVWSFAVLLWELFSLGEVPFARNTREEVEHKIREGVVLTQPLCCPGAIYGMMLSCWNNADRKRPTFENLLHKIKNMVEKFKGQERRLATVSEVPEMPYFVLDPNEEQNNYIQVNIFSHSEKN